MKIIDIIKSEKPTLSMEVFPPKTTDNFEVVRIATEKIAVQSPDFMSVPTAQAAVLHGLPRISQAISRINMTFPCLLI